jgi:methionyl-tRNA formyltransferase
MNRWIFVGQSGPYACTALRALAERSVDFAHVCVGKPSSWKGPALRTLNPVQKHVYQGDDLSLTALSLGFAVTEMANINSDASVRLLKKVDAEYGVCVGFDRLFSAHVLASVKHVFFNAHPSCLPLLRGPSPFFWMLKQGLPEGCVSVHHMVERADAGDVYAREPFHWPQGATGGALLRCAGRAAALGVWRVMQGMAQDTPCFPEVQNNALATRAPRPSVEECQIQPWLWRCEKLYAFACAGPFFASLWLVLGDVVWHVQSAVSFAAGQKIPGQYVWLGEHLTVPCMDGTVTLVVKQRV